MSDVESTTVIVSAGWGYPGELAVAWNGTSDEGC